MTTGTRTFSDFRVGDLAVFEQSFSAEDFRAFAKLSGDFNPLHHDAVYAERSEFSRPIVPMHMTMAPLSRIAGMIFPGDPSLYLGHELRSIMPVLYDDRLTYSARVVAINPTLRTLTLRVLVARGAEVVMDAEMRVMSRLESWPVAADLPDLTPPAGSALITGATGEIGAALAMNLARRGLDLVLVDRGPGEKRAALTKAVAPLMAPGRKLENLTADLADPAAVSRLCGRLAEGRDVTAVFHTASPPLDAPLPSLVQVNYAALQQISQAVIPGMLMRQRGVVATIGSVATERVIPGWHDYSAVKAMAGQFLTAFDKTYSEFGLRGLTILSGLVATSYSASIQRSAPAMLPQELAEHVVKFALDDRAGNAMMIEWSGSRAGRLGFHTDRPAGAAMATSPAGDTSASSAESAATPAAGDLDARIADVVLGRLRLPAGSSLEGGGVGATPGWDSLRHIEIVLELETVFGIRYGAGEVEKMLTYDALVAFTRALVAQR